MRKSQLILLVCILVLTSCTQIHEKVITTPENAENEIAGNQIMINSLKFVYETWIPGNSGHIFSKILVFNLNDKDIALINRVGLKGRDVVQGTSPGISINDGSKIKYGDGKYGVGNFETIVPSECSVEYGAGFKYGTEQRDIWTCDVSFNPRVNSSRGKCLLSCKSKQLVEIINKGKLDECLASKTDEAIPNILKEGVHIYDLDLNSACSFYNGEFLKLIE